MTAYPTTADVAALRARFANDRCECGHVRAEHYDAWGATLGCRTTGCICESYAWRDRPGAQP